ncbi:MAG: 2-hydroxychromene-2-carboxylate isomerase [Pseudomonadota bacterium]
MPKLQFWFEFASTYSYISASRITGAAQAANVTIDYRPFLLGPIFQAQGWNTSPFALYPAKGAAMWRDVERECDALGLPFKKPDPFPSMSVYAARVALIARDEGWIEPFIATVYAAVFAEGLDIADPNVLTGCIRAAGAQSESVLEKASHPETKSRLREATEEAEARGIFGAPTFITEDGELFWGNDRLERAIEWSLKRS